MQRALPDILTQTPASFFEHTRTLLSANATIVCETLAGNHKNSTSYSHNSRCAWTETDSTIRRHVLYDWSRFRSLSRVQWQRNGFHICADRWRIGLLFAGQCIQLWWMLVSFGVDASRVDNTRSMRSSTSVLSSTLLHDVNAIIWSNIELISIESIIEFVL